MRALNFLIKFPPSVSVPLFFVYTVILLVGRFLLGTVIGVFFLLLFLYWAVGASGGEVLSGGELLLWIDGLNQEYKAALLTSLVTVAGFVVAFHGANANWKNQFNAQLKAQLASELEAFFSPLSASINQASIFAQALVDTVNKIQAGTSFEDANFSIRYLQDQQSQFRSARSHISQASSDVHQLIGRNYNILASGWGALRQIQLVASALTEISQSIWIQLPVVDVDRADHVHTFINQVNVTHCLRLVESCDKNSTKISGLVGAIRGYLLSPIIGFNFSAFLSLLADMKNFRGAVSEFHQKFK